MGWNKFKRIILAVVLGIAAGAASAVLYVIAYAIADLYLSGHGMKPTWFDGMADAGLPILVAAFALGFGVAGWRASRSE